MYHVLITGASSGIGQALALEYAVPGVRLSLAGRNAERLSAVAQACIAKGAEVQQNVIDVCDAAAMREWVLACDAALPVDLVIANAGISGGTGGMFEGESEAQVRRIFDVNLNGVLNTVYPLLPQMQERGCGQIAILSSLAGFVGWAGAPAYCGSKAAVRVLGEGLRAHLAAYGVRVNVVCPGFVKSRMTDANDFPMPFLMEGGRAAKVIRNGLNKNKARISFPVIVAFFIWLFSNLPDKVKQKIMKISPSKRELGDRSYGS